MWRALKSNWDGSVDSTDRAITELHLSSVLKCGACERGIR